MLLWFLFKCASCNACYIGETSSHLQNRVIEHIRKDKNSHVYKHIHNSEECFTKYNADCFSILDIASSKFQLKLKENPELNKQVNHLVLLCLYLVFFKYIYFVSILLHWFISQFLYFISLFTCNHSNMSFIFLIF